MKKIILIVAVVLLVGGAFFGIYKYMKKDDATVTLSDQLKSDKPGKVVANLNGQEITVQDLQNFIKTLPEQYQQMPLDVIYPQLLNEIVMERLVQAKVQELNLAQDPVVLEKLELAKKQIIHTIFLQREVDKKLSESKVKSAYNDFLKENPAQEEIRARHILVDTKEQADDLIQKLNAEKGKNFVALANEFSKDQGSGQNGGDLGYFTKQEMVPEFSEAAFKLSKGAYSKEAVKSSFGYHIIKIEDKRKRKQPSYDELKPQLKAQLAREVVNEVLQEMYLAADVKLYDLKGEPLNAAPNSETAAEENADVDKAEPKK